jgi:hypothetical protein
LPLGCYRTDAGINRNGVLGRGRRLIGLIRPRWPQEKEDSGGDYNKHNYNYDNPSKVH